MDVISQYHSPSSSFWLMCSTDLISKPDGLPDAPIKNPDRYLQSSLRLAANGPHVHEYLQEMNREVLSSTASFDFYDPR